MPAEFCHLHVHTQYSMLDGAIRLKKMVGQANEMGMPAVAVTDHANMFGAVQLHNACKGTDVKPILGCEVNFVAGLRGDENERDVHHLVLLASGQEGYQNLVRIVSRAWVDGMVRGQPRVDFDLLREHHKGVVGLSACMGGYLAQEILMKGVNAGREAMAQLRDTFEPGHFFVEMQDHGLPEQKPLNEILYELSKDLALPIVGSNDCHYMSRDDAGAQLALQCIGAGRNLQEMQALHHGSEEIFFKTPEEMAHQFRHIPEAIKNTMLVAEMCAGTVNPLSKPKLPRFEVSAGQTEEAALVEFANKGLQERYEEMRALKQEFDEAVYQKRLDWELEIIISMGFPGYFLIVQDFINWGKKNGVPVGPGRGSGAGSLVAWVLRITDLDPIPYNLLFERFLNPERVSMPDFDVDFCMDNRDKVIDYVRQKYGHQSVGQIATFHLLKSRSVVRDVGRVMGLAPADSGRLATLVPEPVGGKSVPIPDALEQEPRLKAAYDTDSQVKELIDTAMTLEDLARHAGMHAAGVVISEGPLWDHVPVFCPEPGVYVTQYDKNDVEDAGLVKFDFLGLKTLTVIDFAVKLIDKRPDQKEPFDLSSIPMDDPATFALLQSGETTNVFQLESSGMQGLFKQLKPDCFEDIVAAVALYRPGPLGTGMVEDFVQRKHGRVKVEYPHPCLEPILKDTYGVIVYQEQVMQIARDMAGYSLGGADLLRRAMGKKKAEEMEKQKKTFVEGALKQGHAQEDAERIFDLMAYFAGYGFNKSHSAAYALITYQTAYLKTHFPVEFAAGTLSADKDKIDKVVRTVAEARAMGITVLPPSVNESEIDFTVVYDPDKTGQIKRPKDRPVCIKGVVNDPMKPSIRFGLGGVRGVGLSALEAVFEERVDDDGKQAPFEDLFDFAGRVDLRRVNKGVCEALVQCGAFDALHLPKNVHRAQAFAAIESAIDRGKKLAAERNSNQTSLFALMGGGDEEATKALTHPGGVFPKNEPWDQREVLAREKGTLGFYVSGHPLDRYMIELKRFASGTIEALITAGNAMDASVGGSVEGYRERITKTGNRMGFFELEDPTGRIEVIIRPRVLTDELRELLTGGEPVLIRGKLVFEEDRGGGGDGEKQPKILITEAGSLSEALTKQASAVKVRVDVRRVNDELLRALKHTLNTFPGTVPVQLEIVERDQWTVYMNNIGLCVDPSDGLMSSLEKLFGEKVAELR